MSEERAFKGVWIPADIWLNKDLTIFEKAIYAEIDSLDGEKHCWASNEYLAEFCQMSVPTISRTISKLINLGLIEKVSFDGRQRILKVTKQSRLISEISLNDPIDKSDLSASEFLLIRENKKENTLEEPAEPSLHKNINSAKVNSRRNFRQDHEKLEDTLSSGEDIDRQIERKRKSPAEKLRDNCLGEIDDRSFDDETKDLLKEYFIWASSGKDVRRIKNYDLWKSKLNALEQIIKRTGQSAKDIVQQSIDNQWYKFEELNKTEKKTQAQQHEPLADKVKSRSAEEAQRDLDAKRANPNQKWY